MADNTIGQGRSKIQITAADLGRRVSVRRISGVVEGRPEFRDVIGVLTSWDEGVLTVVNRAGEEVHIMEKLLVAGKAVPPAPVRAGRGAVAAHRAVGSVELQRIAGRGWPPVETAPLGGWTLRASAGFTRRANSVLVDGGPGLPLERALERTTEWYAERGLSAYLQLTTGGPGGDTDDSLAAELAGRGWTVEAEALLQTAPLAPLVGCAPTDAVVLSRTPGPDWLARYHHSADPATAGPALAVLSGGPSVWFAVIPGPEGGPAGAAAIGRCVVDGRWAGLGAVEVAPEQRRRGLATAVLAALARAAADEGADLAYLQVEADNEAALRLYGRFGFSTHHRYHYRRAPQPPAR
ncbi:GNAT family N-acetyltransferase [Streptacidiphilus sp. EB129]|uniref:GNAT family N-acetyltransferase n=1 Tax=Streptacidiphilus sp. EB129 TaxID=3156262 RepID=UPI0035119503